MRRLLMTSCVIAALLSVVHAQGQPPPPTSRPAQTARPGQTPPAGDVPAQPAPGAQQTPGQTPRPGVATPATPQQAPQANTWRNIKLDLTITDAVNASTQLRKVISLYIADGRQGQVRSQSEQGLINVDARLQAIRQDGKSILLQLTVEYRQGVSGSLFSESLSVVVTDGQSMILSQTADPSGDRKVSVEVLATIQKS